MKLIEKIIKIFKKEKPPRLKYLRGAKCNYCKDYYTIKNGKIYCNATNICVDTYKGSF